MLSGNQILVKKSASNIDSHIIIFSAHQQKNHTHYLFLSFFFFFKYYLFDFSIFKNKILTAKNTII